MSPVFSLWYKQILYSFKLFFSFLFQLHCFKSRFVSGLSCFNEVCCFIGVRGTWARYQIQDRETLINVFFSQPITSVLNHYNEQVSSNYIEFFFFNFNSAQGDILFANSLVIRRFQDYCITKAIFIASF